MSIGGYKIRNKASIHFISFAVVEWIDVFTRKQYCEIVLDSLRYCQKEKGLVIYAWCLMSNHIHLVVSAKNQNLSDILRDFKKYTSRKIIETIENNSREGRKEWMLQIFRKQAESNSRNKSYQFWRQDNQPKELYSSTFTAQKINYIHKNPVEAGIVEKPEYYIYSSALDYYKGKPGLLQVVLL
jgi:REP element-mobilizing transposase RayT